MCVEKYVEASRVKGLVELTRNPARLNTTIADEEATPLPKKTEALKDAAARRSNSAPQSSSETPFKSAICGGTSVLKCSVSLTTGMIKTPSVSKWLIRSVSSGDNTGADPKPKNTATEGIRRSMSGLLAPEITRTRNFPKFTPSWAKERLRALSRRPAQSRTCRSPFGPSTTN
jgi:hypothetical protein